MRVLAMAVSLLAAVLGGCSGPGADGGGLGAGGGLDVTDATGGMRGIVVDARIVPVEGALVSLGQGHATRSDASGLFNFTGLQEGDYFILASKPGYEPGQTSVHVTAGVRDPPFVKLLLNEVPSLAPFWQPLKLEGFYECGFSAGAGPGDPTGPVTGSIPLISDHCDFALRTAHDEANGTVPSYPLPRTVFKGSNTQVLDLAPSVRSIVQQAYWDDPTVPKLMVTLSSTPIRSDCDCSAIDYLFRYLGPGEVSRADASTNGTTVYDNPEEENPRFFPAGRTVAARGFLSWESVSAAQNFRFTIVTSLFHNHEPPADWTFETSEQHPVEPS